MYTVTLKSIDQPTKVVFEVDEADKNFIHHVMSEETKRPNELNLNGILLETASDWVIESTIEHETA